MFLSARRPRTRANSWAVSTASCVTGSRPTGDDITQTDAQTKPGRAPCGPLLQHGANGLLHTHTHTHTGRCLGASKRYGTRFFATKLSGQRPDGRVGEDQRSPRPCRSRERTIPGQRPTHPSRARPCQSAIERTKTLLERLEAAWRLDVGERERVADEREAIADERDRIADERDRLAGDRDRISDERESVLDRREST